MDAFHKVEPAPQRSPSYDELLLQRNELLAALQRLMRLGTMNDQEAIEAARAAITKATGGANHG